MTMMPSETSILPINTAFDYESIRNSCFHPTPARSRLAGGGFGKPRPLADTQRIDQRRAAYDNPTGGAYREQPRRHRQADDHVSPRRIGGTGYGKLYTIPKKYLPVPGQPIVDFGHCLLRLDAANP